jgi:hypothetical protein
MKNRSSSWACAVLLLAFLLADGRVSAQDPAKSESSDYLAQARQLVEAFDQDRIVARIRELYDAAKASGENVPSDLWAWAREDLDRVGTWQYKVVTIGGQSPARLEQDLNALGRERWDCSAVPIPEGDRRGLFVCKRPARSYLGQLQLRDVLRVLPSGS